MSIDVILKQQIVFLVAYFSSLCEISTFKSTLKDQCLIISIS